MIVVKVELWHGGNPKRAEDLGTALISNISGLADDSAYEVSLLKGKRYSPKHAGQVYKRGVVPRFPRTDRRFGPWELLALALEATVGNRIKRLKKVLSERGGGQ